MHKVLYKFPLLMLLCFYCINISAQTSEQLVDSLRKELPKQKDEKISASLSSEKSRVQYLNGQLSIDSQNEIGTTILMNFLINEGEAVS